MKTLLKNYILRISQLNNWIGKNTAWCTTFLVLLVCFDVSQTYFFKKTSVAFLELEWHLFALVFLFCAGYSLRHDKHVRVDVFYNRMNAQQQAWVNLLGVAIFLIPFCAVIIYASYKYTLVSFGYQEGSPNPGGLPARYLIKGAIPLGFLFLLLQAISLLFESILKVLGVSLDELTNRWQDQDDAHNHQAPAETSTRGSSVFGVIKVIFLLVGILVCASLFLGVQLPMPLFLQLFLLVFVAILAGFPVAFTLGGLSILFGLAIFNLNFFYLLSLRIYGIMNNAVLMAVPLFVYMGIMLEKSGIAERLLETMALLFGRLKGGLAISVVVVGALLAASTGIVGATVITMGLISLPTMIRRKYSVELAAGTIAASGTLGQIIPPSVVLVLLGSVLNISVGDLFTGAFIPGFALVLLYFLYILGLTIVRPDMAPAMPKEELQAFKTEGMWRRILSAFVLPLLLIIAVLGSIFAGIATPTEAAAVGALGATLLTLFQKKLSLKVLRQVMRSTSHITTMVFLILIGASAFSLIFRGLKGDDYIIELINSSNLNKYTFLALVMAIMFIAGFFIDFIEIIFIIVPVVVVTFKAMGLDLLWVGILMAMNLQTSFLTPPFGFALFYLKGVAPPEVKTSQIYRGVVPFIIIQVLLIAAVVIFPEIVTWLPQFLKGK